MRAVGSIRLDPEAGPETLVDLDLPVPNPGPTDVLVRVHAFSVDPLDVPLAGGQKASAEAPRVLGWDASGIIEALGSEVKDFALGDRVFYVGDIRRPGCNAQFQAVDHRLLARIPESLSFAEAAALPLAGLTAWGMLFRQFGLDASSSGNLLVLGGAGGVASLAVTLARALTGTTVIATALRPESRAWLERLGAHHVISMPNRWHPRSPRSAVAGSITPFRCEPRRNSSPTS